MTDEESPEALSVRRGFDDAELATCLKVLRALGSDGGTADATTSDGVGGEMRLTTPRRVPLVPSQGAQAASRGTPTSARGARGQLGHYGKDPKAFRAAKQSKRDLNRRKMQEKAADRESLNQTRMRAARLERLAALEAGHAELPLAIGDGENPSGADPSGADASDENPSAGDPSADPDQAPRRAPLPLVPDGCSGDAAASHSISDASGSSNPTILNQPRQCYVCKRRFRRLHHFYASLCPGVRRAQLGEATANRRPLRPSRPRHGRAREDRLSHRAQTSPMRRRGGGHHAVPRGRPPAIRARTGRGRLVRSSHRRRHGPSRPPGPGATVRTSPPRFPDWTS